MEQIKKFKTIEDFKKNLKKGICWEDYFKIGNLTFKIYEYGGGSLFNMSYDYVYFYNKHTKKMIYIKYDCPSYKWESGNKVLTKPYKFIDLEVFKNPILWRTDTL
jgi:hypothetical protein